MQDKESSTQRYDMAAALLPMRLRRAAEEVPLEDKRVAEEFRLRVGQPPGLLLGTGRCRIFGAADEIVRRGDLERMVGALTEYAPYAWAEQLRRGYLTARGGFRIGLCGSAVQREGGAGTMKEFSSAAIRISREKIGLAQEMVPLLLCGGRFESTLILSPPGGGKTTLLRDMIRTVSDAGERVCLVDERGEIAVMYGAEAQMTVGRNTDVLDGYGKAEGILMALRAMNPQVLALDEITAHSDAEAITTAANCGVALLASVHAGSVDELTRKQSYKALLEQRIFRHTVTIYMCNGKRLYSVEDLPC